MELSSRTIPFNQKKRLVVIQLGAIASTFLLLFCKPAWNEESIVHELIETIGMATVMFCVFGRLWSTLYIGGMKNSKLTTSGPYSITRNPLYFFSTAGAIGIGLAYGSLFAAAALGVLMFLIFWFTANEEAKYLSFKFGSLYERYARRTPFFLPNPFLYRDLHETQFSPTALKSTFSDCLYFLAVFPFLEVVEYIRDIDMLPSIISIY